MATRSSGILLFRRKTELEFFLVHPGGPFWKNKDEGSWSIPKGEFTDEEDPLAAALREFKEETGMEIDGVSAIPLGQVKMKSGKVINAWAIEGDLDPQSLQSNLFEIEWPPKSGKKQSFPEVDRGEWFEFEEAELKINRAQVAFLKKLKLHLNEAKK